jgi:lipoate-protein ligase A
MRNFFILNLSNLPIIEQLRLEEALLRADTGNWCLINSGTSDAIVMGISGKAEQLIDQKIYHSSPVPLIKRFSGGGTVYVDKETIFVTFIANETCTQVACQPRKIMEWTDTLYSNFFSPHPFQTQENDYAMGDKKFGGNAQYIQRGRWLHHTSFLWDYESQKMAVLTLPQKRPAYRVNRSHDEFLTKLSLYYENKNSFIQSLSTYLKTSLSATELSLQEVEGILLRPHRKALSVLTIY